MRDQLRALVRISEIDDAAREIDRELKEVPARVEELKADLDRLDGMLQSDRRELSDAEQLLDAQLEQIAQSNDGLSRAKAKGAKARNAREVDAAEREMETIRRTVREREEENEKLKAAIDEKRTSLSGSEEKLAEFRKIYEEEAAQAKARVEELQGERGKVTAGRGDVLEKLPRNLVSRYERIRTKHANAVVEAVDMTCTGCRLQIPPQQYNVLLSGTTIEQCPHCLRIVYSKDAILD